MMEQAPVASEKAGLFMQDNLLHEAVKSRRKRTHVLKAVCLAGFILMWWSYSSTSKITLNRSGRSNNQEDVKPKFVDFTDIPPSEKLEWHSCPDANTGQMLLCARLTVPMDYNRPLNASKFNPKVHVAIVLVPGIRSDSTKFSKSPLLLNPGGPGGSGTAFASMAGRQIQKVVGEDQDVIGFDPRGIGFTTPRADCFAFPIEQSPGNPGESFEEDYNQGFFHRMLWDSAGREIGNVNSTADSLTKLDNRARTVAKLCQDKDSWYGDTSILKYISTPSVARDMLSIVDAWDEWLDSLGPDAVYEDKTETKTAFAESQESYSLDTKGKLVYWGFSYGTLLGATFAAMFPKRVGRVVLDGVVDADHYVSPVWTGSIRDADAIYNSFPKYCHEAEERCALFRYGDKPSDIADRLEAVLNRVKDSPILTINPSSRVPVIATYSDLKRILFSVLYSPNLGFVALAQIVNLLFVGYDDILGQLFAYPARPLFCGPDLSPYLLPSDAQNAIMCSDKRYPMDETVPNLEKMFEDLASDSSFADVWMSLMIGCDAWGIEAVDPPMDWDDHPDHKWKPVNTSFPVLFVSNTYDPVTPLAAGLKMALKFQDAGLIEQQSEGHCSISSVSRCTIHKIRAYFRDGKVSPRPIKGGKGHELSDGQWDRCKSDEWPFHPYDGDEIIAKRGAGCHAEVESMDAVKELQKKFTEMKFFGVGGVNFNIPDLAG